MQKRVIVMIGVDGKCQIDAQGFVDAGCKTATDAIIKALGGEPTMQRDKPEARNAVRTRGGERLSN